MAGAQNQTAAYAIERSCINKSSVLVYNKDKNTLDGHYVTSFGDFNLGAGYVERALVINIFNANTFSITDLNVAVTNRKTGEVHYYDVDRFLGVYANGVMLAGPAEPAFEQIIRPFGTSTFYVKISETSQNNVTFSRDYYVEVVPFRGIL